MISLDRARELALEKIRSCWFVPEHEPSIQDDHREEDFGWVFFYDSKRFHETKDFRFALSGHGPVVVDKETGEVSMLGTTGGVERQLADYRKQRSRY